MQWFNCPVCGTPFQDYPRRKRFTCSQKCGQSIRSDLRTRNYKHGHCLNYNASPTYKTWLGVLNRCLNSKSRYYPRYGGRGISVCEQWRQDFQQFVMDVGKKPAGKSLDRIDNNKGYEPGNVKWSTPKEQNNNKRNNHVIVYQEITATLAAHCERIGVRYKTAFQRFKKGWTFDDVFSLGKFPPTLHRR